MQNVNKPKISLTIKIISAQNLPRTVSNRELVKDISDSFVVVTLYGIPIDQKECRTHTIKNNGYNPFWNRNFTFDICYPQLAFVKFTVKDKDLGHDDVIGDYAIRVENMREGLSLKSKISFSFFKFFSFFL